MLLLVTGARSKFGTRSRILRGVKGNWDCFLVIIFQHDRSPAVSVGASGLYSYFLPYFFSELSKVPTTYIPLQLNEGTLGYLVLAHF